MDTLAENLSLNRENGEQNPRIAILGAGFSGMGMAIELMRRGLDNFTIYEKADEFGGTWRENTYPGVACDVPSHLYSFSFEPNPNWSRRYSPGPEIWDYMKHCARKYGLYERTQFGKKITAAVHDGAKWRIEFADGSHINADIVVSGLGGLHEPNIPDFDGAEKFDGPIFHTAQWRHDIDLTGKRVAMIGSAASAIQVTPEIAPVVAHLDIYQRTANWVMPRESYRYPNWLKGVFNAAPFLARAYRGFYFSLAEWRHKAFQKDDNFMKRQVRGIFTKHMEAQVPDEALREKLTPEFDVGCKRILISDNYLPAVQRDNVDLVTERIAGFEPKGVRLENGEIREADAIILATGFKPFNLLDAIDVTGPDGKSLAEKWSGGITAHRTIAAPGMPNFFMLLGPNSGLGHNSVILMIEAQVKYVTQLIDAMKAKNAKFVEPSPAAAKAFDGDLQAALGQMVWASGCQSWYLDEHGRNYTLSPHSVRAYIAEMKQPNLSEYQFKKIDERLSA